MSYTTPTHPLLQPRSRKGYRFALTPLADAMFQLLIFFMLTSGLTPYALITIQSAPQIGTSESDPEALPSDEAIVPGENARIWQVEKGRVIANGLPVTPDQLSTLAASVSADENAQVILVMEPSAEVQDLTSVLEALTSAGVTAVQIAQTEASQ